MPDECDTNITERRDGEEEEEEKKSPAFYHFSLTTQFNEWPQAPWNAAYKETGLTVCHDALGH